MEAPSNRIRITKSRAGSHPRRILADQGKIQLLAKLPRDSSPNPFEMASDKKL